MTTVIIVIHLMVVLAMIGLVLLQRSEGGALGIGGGQGAFMTGRGAGNILTRTTGILAVAFFATSLALAIVAKYESRPSDILERLPEQTPQADTDAPAGAPSTAEDLLREFGATGGPQTPPADGAADAPAAAGEATPPAAETSPAPAPEVETQPSPQTPPAEGAGQ